jgi:alkylated DNA nucleotide flippase Atl1
MQGKISLQGDSAAKQRMRLEAEGIEFDARGKIDLKRFRWAGLNDEFAPSQPSLFE